MKTSSAQGLFTGFASLLAVAAFVMSPTQAHADVTVQTRQLLAGNGSCAQPTVTDVHPYVYDGYLNSFDITVADAAKQVVVSSVVGGMPIPFNMVTRWGTDNANAVRMHVDITKTAVASSLPIQMTLLSTDGPNTPVCATNISFSVPASAGTNMSVSHETPAPATSPVSENIVPAYVQPAPVVPAAHMQATSDSKNATGAGITSGIAQHMNLLASTSKVSIGSLLGGFCSTQRSAANTWAILLVLYALLVAYAALLKPGVLVRSAEALAAVIVLPFVLLVGFWYFAEMCRPGQWVQLLAPAIALIGLVVAFWEDIAPARK